MAFVTTTDTQEERENGSGVIWRRRTALRWTNRFPSTSGFYWVRPIEARFNTIIRHVDNKYDPKEFEDVEFSNRSIPRPIEAEADDEAEMTAYATGDGYALHQYEIESESNSKRFMFWTGMSVGALLGVAAMFGMQWLSIHH